MKGVLYNVDLKKKDGKIITFNNLNMTELVENIQNFIYEYYNIDKNLYKLNNQIIYNIMTNRKSNQLLRGIIDNINKVKKINKK